MAKIHRLESIVVLLLLELICICLLIVFFKRGYDILDRIIVAFAGCCAGVFAGRAMYVEARAERQERSLNALRENIARSQRSCDRIHSGVFALGYHRAIRDVQMWIDMEDVHERCK